jgi:hypothetical protein
VLVAVKRWGNLRSTVRRSIHGSLPKQLQPGVYLIHHFNLDFLLHDAGYRYDMYPELPINAYGVCDTVEQVLEQSGIADLPERYVVSLTEIRRDEEPEWGGWRWHKWGPYIGTRTPTTEYLHDEPEIDRVYVYHIYRVEEP